MEKNKIEVKISDDTNGILHFVKDRNKLKDLGEAIDFIAGKYEDNHMELKPEFISKIRKIEKQKSISFKNINELRKHIESK